MKYTNFIILVLLFSILFPYTNAIAGERDFPKDDTSIQQISEIISAKILELNGKPFPGGIEILYGSPADIRRPTRMILEDTVDPSYVGFVVQFSNNRWGGWTQEWKDYKDEHILVDFRNGIVGSCKAIPVYVQEGTEARIRWFSSYSRGFMQRQYIYRNNKWHFVSQKKFKDPPGIGDARE